MYLSFLVLPLILTDHPLCCMNFSLLLPSFCLRPFPLSSVACPQVVLRFYCPEPAAPRLGSWLLAISLIGVIECFLSLVGIVFLYLVDWVLVLLTHCCPSGSVFAAGTPVGFLSRYFGRYRAFNGEMGEACIVGVIAATCITLVRAYWRGTWCQRYEVCCRCSAIEPVSLPPGLYCHLICGFPFSCFGVRSSAVPVCKLVPRRFTGFSWQCGVCTHCWWVTARVRCRWKWVGTGVAGEWHPVLGWGAWRGWCRLVPWGWCVCQGCLRRL